MNEKILTICIPTFNRKCELHDLLLSIADESMNAGVDILVSDNASIDGTGDLVGVLQKTMPNLKYIKNEKNVGFDKNILKLIENSSTDYIWFLGDDDGLFPGGISRVLNEIEDKKISGLLINGIPYDSNLKEKIGDTTVMNRKISNNDMNFSSSEALFEKFGDYVGFISANVIKTSILKKILIQNKFDNFLNGYVHIYLIGSCAKIEPFWKYISTPIIKWRSDNDSLKHIGMYRRLELDILEYDRIMSELFGEHSNVRKSVNERICSSILASTTLHLNKNNLITKELRKKIIKLTFIRYCKFSVYWYKIIPYLYLPRLVTLEVLCGIRKFRSWLS